MFASPVYTFDPDDKDIAFLKENWGDDLKDFYFDKGRPYWPGSSAEFGGFDGIGFFLENELLLEKYYQHLQDRVDRLLSSWATPNRQRLRDTIAVIAEHSKMSGENSKDKVAQAFQDYSCAFFDSLEKISSIDDYSLIQFRKDIIAAHEKLITLVKVTLESGILKFFPSIDSVNIVQTYHFMVATAEYNLYALSHSPNPDDRVVLAPAIYLMILTAEIWYLKHQKKTRASFKGEVVNSPDKFIIAQHTSGNIVELVNLSRDFFLKGCIYNLISDSGKIDKAGVRKTLTYHYDSYIEALPEYIIESMSDPVRKGLSAKRYTSLLNQLQENGSLITRLTKVYDGKLKNKFIDLHIEFFDFKMGLALI